MLSAVLACFNESHYLDQSLPRLGFCDEIIVFDLGSTDGSAAAAQRQGAVVIPHAWVPFREKIIQKMLDAARYDWVLMTDPDLLIPAGAGRGIKTLITDLEDAGLGAIYLPMVTCYSGQPLRYGQKSGRRAYRAVVHKERVSFSDLLHHKGVSMAPNYFPVCLRSETPEDDIQHHWIDTWSAAMAKARRYLPHEGRTRHATGQLFSWPKMLQELFDSLKVDLRRFAFLDWHATQVMLFQLWYTWRANLALRDYERNALQNDRDAKPGP